MAEPSSDTNTSLPMRLILTQTGRVDRLREFATILQEPSSSDLEEKLCSHPGKRILQFDQGNSNDGRRFKFVRLQLLTVFKLQ